jgi:hypothetical protein
MARRAAEIVAVKVRMGLDLRKQIEKLADMNDRSVNSEIVRLLEGAVLAEKAGVGGIAGVAKAIQGSSAAAALEDVIKRLEKLEGKQ